MKKIYVNVEIEVEVTDEEHGKLRDMAFKNEMVLDNPYNSIKVPEWLEDKMKENGRLVPESGIIPANQWIEKPFCRYRI